MKFQMNGALTIGTLDGANVEILELVGPENFFLFGATADKVLAIRDERRKGLFKPDPRFIETKDWLLSEVFKSSENTEICQTIDCVMGSLEGNEGFGTGDYFLVGYDFPSFLEAISHVDEAYKDRKRWMRMSIIQTSMSGKFSSDRTIRAYAEEIWEITENPVEKNN
jgi:starch phosphorylase